MNRHYADLLGLVDRPPTWWDESAVPRFCDFHPSKVDIYADECCLVLIQCQYCHHSFKVAFSWSYGLQRERLTNQVLQKTLAYGDPPNLPCCSAGPTMTSNCISVLEFWTREDFYWVRHPGLEITLSDYNEG